MDIAFFLFILCESPGKDDFNRFVSLANRNDFFVFKQTLTALIIRLDIDLNFCI